MRKTVLMILVGCRERQCGGGVVAISRSETSTTYADATTIRKAGEIA